MSELLACPFCGDKIGVSLRQPLKINSKDQHKGWLIDCEDCGAESGFFADAASAVKFWNRRAPLPSVLPIPAPDPRYDARCALMDKTDWSAA